MYLYNQKQTTVEWGDSTYFNLSYQLTENSFRKIKLVLGAPHEDNLCYKSWLTILNSTWCFPDSSRDTFRATPCGHLLHCRGCTTDRWFFADFSINVACVYFACRRHWQCKLPLATKTVVLRVLLIGNFGRVWQRVARGCVARTKHVRQSFVRSFICKKCPSVTKLFPIDLFRWSYSCIRRKQLRPVLWRRPHSRTENWACAGQSPDPGATLRQSCLFLCWCWTKFAWRAFESVCESRTCMLASFVDSRLSHVLFDAIWMSVCKMVLERNG